MNRLQFTIQLLVRNIFSIAKCKYIDVFECISDIFIAIFNLFIIFNFYPPSHEFSFKP